MILLFEVLEEFQVRAPHLIARITVLIAILAVSGLSGRTVTSAGNWRLTIVVLTSRVAASFALGGRCLRGTLTRTLSTVIIRSRCFRFFVAFDYFGLALKVFHVSQTGQVRRQDYFSQFGVEYASANYFKRIVHKFNLRVLWLF